MGPGKMIQDQAKTPELLRLTETMLILIPNLYSTTSIESHQKHETTFIMIQISDKI